MEIWCAVVGVDSVFSVVVSKSARVEDLQYAIAGIVWKSTNGINPTDLTLFLARKPNDSTWLEDSHEMSRDLANGNWKSTFRQS